MLAESAEEKEIINEHGVSVTRIKPFTDQEITTLRNTAAQIVQKLHENRKKMILQATDMDEVVMFGSICYGYGNTNFTVINVSDEFKVVNPDNFSRLFISYNNYYCNFIPYDKVMREAFIGPIIRLFEALCERNKLSGRVIFRGHVKSFIGKKSLLHRELKNQLGWHYDYSAKTTAAMEILNDLAECGTLLFAKNGYKGERSGFHGDSQRQVAPIEKTIMSVKYSRDTAIIFDHKRGDQIHCPATVTIPKSSNKKTYARVVIQVVIYDANWMKGKEW